MCYSYAPVCPCEDEGVVRGESGRPPCVECGEGLDSAPRGAIHRSAWMSRTKSELLWKNAVGGGVAGAVEVCLMYPTELVKTRMQLDPKAYRGPLHCAASVVRERGVRGLYRGLTTLVAGSIPKAAIRFAAFQQMAKGLKDKQGKLSAGNTVICGLAAGAAEALFAVTPAETIKTKMIHDQNQVTPKYRGLVHGLID